MLLTKTALALLLSLLTALSIFFITPSNKYLYTPRPELFKINNFLFQDSLPLIPKFSDLTLQSGLFFTHTQGDHHLSSINESLGSGVCVFDYDNDGWQDLFLVNGSGQTRFYGKMHW